MSATIRSLGLLLFPAVASLAGAAPAPLTRPTEIKPSPAVIQCAAAQKISLDGFALATGPDEARTGDKITVLFTIQEGPAERQWLAEFRLAQLTESEKDSKPGSGLGLLSVFQSSLKTDTGHTFSFPQNPLALELRTFGPFTRDDLNVTTSLPVTARILATRDYLVHGLAPMGEIELRLRRAGKMNPGLSYLFLARFSDEQMTASRARAAASGFTEEDERVYAEGIFALVQFANLAFRTDGVDVITREMVDSPTLFSGAFTNFDWPRMQAEDGRAWDLPGAQVFQLPYRFNSKTTARGNLFFTVPRPPLQNIAGIIGLTVDWSSKTATKRLIMRVLADERGGP